MLDMLARVLKILDDLGNCDAQDEYSKGWDNAISTAYDAVENLRNECHHPIKFNDLKDGMWYWDCKAEMYCLCKYSVANVNEVLMMYLGYNARLSDAIFDEHRYIVERIYNPPLKFNELEEDMWIFDNRDKEYKQISRMVKEKQAIWWYGTYTEYEADMFEENRFYRREVQEE